MELLFEILKSILPAIIAGVSTFLVTKYTYNKNIPLDKLEISYNRIYYPLYELITNRNDSNYDEYKIYLDSVIYEAEWRINKYRKYVDRPTVKAFNLIYYSNTQVKKETNFYNFKDIIQDRNFYLRRRLGYLEPNILQSYKYSSYLDKFLYRILIECCFAFISLILSTLFTDNLQIVFEYIANSCILILFMEFGFRLLLSLYYKIAEVIELIRGSK